MKLQTRMKLLSWLLLILTITGCVKDEDYSVPTIDDVQPPKLKVTNTIASIIDMYYKSVVDFDTVGTDLVIEGYVVSSDESGNIYKVLHIQDKPKNPTSAIQIAVDATDLYTFYEVGRKVYVKLNGLALHNANGVLQIGQLQGTSVKRIAPTDYKNHIIRTAEVVPITPLSIENLEDISDTHISMLIQLNDMRAVEKGSTYATSYSTYPVNRQLESCKTRQTIAMRNSGYADFKGQQIPDQRGNIRAILGKYGNDYQLFIRDTDDVNFTQPYDCENNTIPLKSIAEIKALYQDAEMVINEWAKIKAIVTSDVSTKNINDTKVYVQDATAGMALQFDTPPNLQLGDEVDIAVKNTTIDKSNGVVQLQITPNNILSQQPSGLPSPKTITLEQAFSKEHHMQLVTIETVQFKDTVKRYGGANELTSDCKNSLSVFVQDTATFANTPVSNKRGSITGVLVPTEQAVELYIRNENDMSFNQPYTNCNTTGGNTNDDAASGKFDFEDLNTTSTSYSTSGTITAQDGTTLKYLARTNVGKYKIEGKGLMLKNTSYITLTFPKGIKKLKFKCRAAFTHTSDRVVIINEGDENSTTELKKVTFPYDTTLKNVALDLNKKTAYTLTIKGGTTKQIVIDDIEWTL